MINQKNKRYFIWCIAILLSAFGNALPTFSDAGAAPWTSACINIGITTGLQVGTVFNILAVGFFTFNKIYTKEKLGIKDLYLIVFSMIFGMIINLMLNILYMLFPVPTNEIVGGVVSLFGTACIAAALALFIRANILMLPIDDFIKNLAIICKNNVILSGLISFGLGILIAVAFGLYNGEIVAVNYITIINFFVIGHMIDFFNKRFKFVDNYLSE